MKQLKISCKKVLQACLDKTKVTTIRKAWSNILSDPEQHLVDKPCKYKIGDVCEVAWTGLGCIKLEGQVDNCLGTIKITRIEKINIGLKIEQTTNVYSPSIYSIKRTNKDLSFEDYVKLSKSEGFKSVDSFFKFMQKYSGGLTEPKPFWLISFKWVV